MTDDDLVREAVRAAQRGDREPARESDDERAVRAELQRAQKEPRQDDKGRG